MRFEQLRIFTSSMAKSENIRKKYFQVEAMQFSERNNSHKAHPSQLLKKNPLKRLGAGERDANEVKGEKFFEVNHCILTFFYHLKING